MMGSRFGALGFAIVVCGWLLVLSESKVFSNAYNIHNFRRNEGWMYIGRMNLNPGKVTISLLMSVAMHEQEKEEYNFEMVAVPNSLWSAELENKCKLERYSAEMLRQRKQKEIRLPIRLQKSSGYHSVTSIVTDLSEKTLFNFVLRNCSRTFEGEGFKRTRVSFELDVRNNQTHISAHEDYYTWVLPLIMVLQVVVLFILRMDTEQDGDNWTKYILKISLWVGVGSLLIKYLGHIIYLMYGRNYQFFDVLYLLVHSASDSILLFLLVLLSLGWTVTFFHHKDEDIYLPLGFMLGFIHMILTVLNKVTDGHDKYHMFDTIPAYIMIFFRLAAFAFFAFGIIKSIVRLKAEESKMKGYFWQLAVLGTIYMIIVPVAVIAVELVQVQHREYLMLLGLQSARLLISIWLGVLAGWRYSSYRRVLNTSFMQKDQKYY